MPNTRVVSADQLLQIEQHADRDEKQPQQQLTKRPDDRIDLMTVLGLGQQHPGQERTQRHRQPEQLRDPRGRQHDQQCREREQLAQATVGNFV
jgi:hypothetical protein